MPAPMAPALSMEEISQRLARGDRSVLADLPQEVRTYIEQALVKDQVQGAITKLLASDFTKPPVSHNVFIENDYYLGKIGKSWWRKWRDEWDFVMDPKNEISEWRLTGSIGIGKTSKAVAALCYVLYLLTLHRDPQSFFGVEPGSPIVLAFFNIFKYLAEDTSFTYFLNYMRTSPYFRTLRKDDKDKSLISFPNGITIAVGAQSIHALGQNIISGLLDEANFGRRPTTSIETEKGQIEKTYIGVRDRIVSRFLNPLTKNTPGLLCLVSSPRDEGDFMAKHLLATKDDPHAHTSSFALYEMKEELNVGPKFFVLIGDRYRKSEIIEDREKAPPGYLVLDVPELFRPQFTQDIDEAIQNIAGRPTYGSRLLLPQRDRLYKGLETSTSRHHPFNVEEAMIGVRDETTLVQLIRTEHLVKVQDKIHNRIVPAHYPEVGRFIRVDLSRSKDKTGFAMGCIGAARNIVRYDADGKAYKARVYTLWIDFMLRIKAPPGDEIDFGKIRDCIIYIRDQLHFRITEVSGDQFTWPLLQELRKRNFDNVNQTSVDTDPNAYLLLKELHLEDRVDFYAYQPYIDEITTVKDLIHGQKRKIDHPEGGSKDVTDAVSGLAFNAFTTELSEYQDVNVADPTALRRVMKPIERQEEELLKPADYGRNPLERLFGRK